jgi:hypothetical protein
MALDNFTPLGIALLAWFVLQAMSCQWGVEAFGQAELRAGGRL